MASNPPSSLFQVYLRLRPPISQQADQPERCLTVEEPDASHSSNDGSSPASAPTHITTQPPSDARKRGVERFGFTQVFDESATQLNVFEDTGLQSLVKGVLLEQRDGLVATLGVSGSGKSHTILGSKTQRGITQMSLDVIFKSLASTIKPPENSIPPYLLASVSASDASESQMFTAQTFLDAVYGESDRGRNSRAQTPLSSTRAHTPMAVWKSPLLNPLQRIPNLYPGQWGLSQYLYKPASLAWTKTTTSSSNALQVTASDSHSPSPLPRNHQPSTAELHDANVGSIKDPMPALIFPRRHAPMRASTLPRSPDVSHLTLELNPHSEYIVLVSMYEVYNDRIFDLLSPAIVPGQGSAVSRQGASSQKERRKHLYFKSTEGSPDRKVVAGLRKIACSTYEEALAVLEVGLTERKVTGTGANSVSSRSHGFFCLEVKRRMRNKRTGEETWIGNTLTVADLAGSERARTAKTAGSTLVEAGKINESLMYLGQCLQMQSSNQEGNKTAMVPYRQCKLTELLFSNSFPSQQTASMNRNPQRAIMIVTADPLGDYNATSQILRYSALAREVTVPRAPSAESLLSSTLGSRTGSNGRHSPQLGLAEDLEKALADIEWLTAENERLGLRLTEEEMLRAETETALIVSEDRCLLIEQEVREECWAEMEERMEQERKRWQSAWDEQTGHNDDHIDKKIELLSRGFQIHEDPQPSCDERVEELEFENDQLRSRITALERELHCRSPTKKSKSKNTALESSRNANILGRESDIEVALRKMDQLKLADSMFRGPVVDSPGKKQRKMATRKWDLAPEDDL
ncbi:kinesin family protein [Aspergillus mulundensis]|uniref:Kinesin class 6 (MKLP1 group) n=1 Tax=Aspergillus mulundensis TaxID=1810919 RepID=A0A3D8SKJ8_9EURO|nr:Kinesin class 6 (MKLP1 group) [Aspergillus mulundensis]RDW86847.1 Kinesin class 6 (MKLP1 group) [Aspergillus mulundensis]